MACTRLRCTLSVLLGIGAAASSLHAQSAASIDPFLGAGGGGNVFVGPALPYGMAKPGPDTGSNTGNSGWAVDGVVNGFSQTHVSGTGGAPKYGNILVQPTTGDVTPLDVSSPRAREQASAGYYAVTLQRSGVRAELTATRRCSFYRFSYPVGQAANLVIDVGHALLSQRNGGQIVTASQAKVVSSTEVQGSTSVTRGWNRQNTPYTVFFYAVTDTPAAVHGTWQEGRVDAGSNDESYTMPYDMKRLPGIGPAVSNGAYLTFPGTEARVVNLKLGISFVSVEQAKRNVSAEVKGFDFDGVHAAAIAAWDKALSPIELSGASQAELQKFSTAIYHTLLMPVDRTGENPLWRSDEPYYDDFYTMWDTFRTSNPLITLIDEKRETGILRAVIDIQQHEGFLPDGRSGNFSGTTQGGSDTDMAIVDGYLKHLPGVDWAKAYEAVVKDAEVTPHDSFAMGRGDLEEWKTLGYLSIEGSHTDRPGSRTMEYAANDAAIALMAAGMGHREDATKYRLRGAQWKNLWDKDAVADTEEGPVKGFIWTRYKDGSWKSPFDAKLEGTFGQDTFYEGSSWTYSLYVPQDVRGLVEIAGGTPAFVTRLDQFFSPKVSRHDGRFDVGNEPGFLSPWLYIWAGRQDRTAAVTRAIMAKSYKTGVTGLPGNDDSGAMSSLYIFTKLGFFPVAGQATYLIGSPYFPRSSIKLANGKTFTVVAWDVSDANLYIASAKWNGKPWTKSWFTHDQLIRGGTLELQMTDKPVRWDTGGPPPSMSDAVKR